jgi:hypothetical protein
MKNRILKLRDHQGPVNTEYLLRAKKFQKRTTYKNTE